MHPACTAARRYIPLQSPGAEEPSPARHCCSKEEELQQCRACSGKEAPEDSSYIDALGVRTTRCIFFLLGFAWRV